MALVIHLTLLSCEFPVLKIFGFGDGSVDINGEAGDILYASYLSMARAGLVSLEMWDPKSQKWGQPHSQARFAILKVGQRARSIRVTWLT